MTENNSKHLPQVEWFYDGYIFPFVGKADLKTLIQWRADKLNSETFTSYNKDARNTYYQHLDCIEQCIKILFSNPTPDFALNELAKQQAQRELEDQKAKERANILLSKLTTQEEAKLLKIAEKFFK